MLAILSAEWRRLRADRASHAILALLAVMLFASALSSGFDARAHRAHLTGLEADWVRGMAERAVARPAPATDARQAMMRTFQFARADAPHAILPALGGLGLAGAGFHLLPPAIRVSVESRHTDVRSEERLANPLLQGFAMPAFATVVAMLVPFALVCLCAGLVQHAREQGVWRLTVVQCPHPGLWLATTLGLRAGAVWAIVALASCGALLLDPGSSVSALLWWQLAVASFVAAWTLACALTATVASSSSSALLLGIAAWLLTTFVVPAAMAWHLDRQLPMPSRLAAIVQIRDAQQRAETDAGRLLAAWYLAHPDYRPTTPTSHTWPVSFLPRYLAQDAELGPLMQRFDEIRAQRHERAAAWAWLSPSLRMAMLADELAGTDAPRYLRYVRAVNGYETQWRAVFVPRIMSYGEISEAELRQLPRFAGLIGEETAPDWRHAVSLICVSGILALVLWLPAPRQRYGAG